MSSISRACAPCAPALCLLILCLPILCLPIPQAQAHETLPAQWCADPSLEPQIVAQFNLAPAQLRSAAQSAEQALGSAGLIAEGLAEEDEDGRCGIVDKWLMTQYLGSRFCAAYTTGGLTPQLVVTGPSAFFSANHHSEFNYSQGVQGACVVCVPSRQP